MAGKLGSSAGAVLYRHLLAYQIYGANTEVGKTICSTILSGAFSRERPTFYLKPVSTGPLTEADDFHVTRFTENVRSKCLWQFGEPVSPHIAAGQERGNLDPPPTDISIVGRVLEHIRQCAEDTHGEDGVVLVETAGGVHSPTPSGTSQADAYRPMRLPVILIADPKLGGISSTISAFESLHLRGYDLDSVLVFENERYQNHDYLSSYFQDRGIATLALPPPPERMPDAKSDQRELATYYDAISKSEGISELLRGMKERHIERLEQLENLAEVAHKTIWYPFTQHQGLKPENILTIDSAYGDFFQTLTSQSPSTPSTTISKTSSNETALLQSTFDASASWWTQGLGHGSPTLSLAAAHAAGRYGHVMFAGAIHEPALSLAAQLLKHLNNPRLSRVFYSDNGSTGMEVAVKMALTAASRRYTLEGKMDSHGNKERGRGEVAILGLKGSYHGDTIGAMDMCEQSTYNEKVNWYQGRGYWFDFPQVGMKDGGWTVEAPQGMDADFGVAEKFESLDEIFDTSRDNGKRRELYEEYITRTLTRLVREQGIKFGALVLEPVVLGAGGMLFCDPLFQRTLVNIVRSGQDLFGHSFLDLPTDRDSKTWQGLPVIFDEVFTGLYRLGTFTPSALLHIHPDISVHAKLLTGGLLPLCITTASESIYEAFLGDEKSDALLHGHSYTAHAIGCEVAQTSLQAMLCMESKGGWEEFRAQWRSGATSVSKVSQFSALSQKSAEPDPPLIWSMWGRDFITQVSRMDNVDSVFALGSVLSIRLLDQQNSGYTSVAATGLQKDLYQEGHAPDFNIHSRVLGNVLYLMASMTSKAQDLSAIETRLLEVLSQNRKR